LLFWISEIVIFDIENSFLISEINVSGKGRYLFIFQIPKIIIPDIYKKTILDIKIHVRILDIQKYFSDIKNKHLFRISKNC